MLVQPSDKDRLYHLIHHQLESGLFHSDHAQEMGLSLKTHHDASSTTFTKNYTFALLDSLTQSGNTIINSLPMILQEFLEAYASTKDMLFDFYIFLDMLVVKCGAVNDYDKSMRLDIQCQLLKILYEKQVYRPTNEQSSKEQGAYLASVRDRSLQLAESLEGTFLCRMSAHLTKARLRNPVIRIWNTLLNLDYTLMENSISQIWKIVLVVSGCTANSHDQPHTDTSVATNAFLHDLITVFAKSRKLEVLLLNVLDALQSGGEVDTSQVTFFHARTLDW